MDAAEETAPDAVGSERSLTPGMTLRLRASEPRGRPARGAVWLFVVTGNTAGPGAAGFDGLLDHRGRSGVGLPRVAAATARPPPGAGPTSGSEVIPPSPVASARGGLPPLPDRRRW